MTGVVNFWSGSKKRLSTDALYTGRPFTPKKQPWGVVNYDGGSLPFAGGSKKMCHLNQSSVFHRVVNRSDNKSYRIGIG